MAGDLPPRGAGAARRLLQLRAHLQQRRGDEPQAVGHPYHGVGQPDAEDGVAQRAQLHDKVLPQPVGHRQRREPAVLQRLIEPHRHKQEHPQEGQTGQQPRHRARDQHAVVEKAGDVVRFAVHGDTDKQIADHRQHAAEDADSHRVDDRPQQVGLLPDIVERRQRQLIPQRHADAPVGDKGPQRHAEQRHADGHRQPGHHHRPGHPAPFTQRQRPRLRRLALHGDKAVGGAHQPPLEHHQRDGDADQHHRHRRHQMVGGGAELVGQLIEIGRQHHVALGVAQHQHQTEDFQTEEKEQHAGVKNGRPHHRQTHRGHHLQRRGADGARRLFHVRADAAQRRGDIEIRVRHVG